MLIGNDAIIDTQKRMNWPQDYLKWQRYKKQRGYSLDLCKDFILLKLLLSQIIVHCATSVIKLPISHAGVFAYERSECSKSPRARLATCSHTFPKVFFVTNTRERVYTNEFKRANDLLYNAVRK